jgi:hypothetical protein
MDIGSDIHTDLKEELKEFTDCLKEQDYVGAMEILELTLKGNF